MGVGPAPGSWEHEHQEVSTEQSPKLARVLEGHEEVAGLQQSAEAVGGVCCCPGGRCDQRLWAGEPRLTFPKTGDTERDRQKGQTYKMFV